MKKLVNLTPHPINVYLYGTDPLVIPPSGQVARVSQVYQDLGHLDLDGHQIPLAAAQYGPIQGLPDPQPGVLYVTSGLVAQAAWNLGRTDVLAPDTGAGAVRDSDGKIIGVRRLLAHPGLKL